MIERSTVSPLAARVSGVSKTFGSGENLVHALRGIDLEIESGRMTAVMGQSGSGKSTLLQVMAGLDQPTTGSVVVGGQQLTGLSDDELTVLRRTRMGFVFQAFNLLPSLSAIENIRLPFLLAGSPIRG